MTMSDRNDQHELRRWRRLGMSPWLVVGLATLGVPRVIAHDLGPVGGLSNQLLVYVPIAIWLAVVLWRRVPNPFVTLLAIGGTYGILAGVTHQILWEAAFDEPPRLGGNLAGQLSAAVEAVVLRVVAFLSSLITGIGVGAVTGLAGWLIAKFVPGLRSRTRA